MHTLAILASLTSVAFADWTFYCGSSCSSGTAIASGTGYDAVIDCTAIGATYQYCYMVADESYTKAIAFENDECVVNSTESESNGLFNGDCTDAGSWTAYLIELNL